MKIRELLLLLFIISGIAIQTDSVKAESSNDLGTSEPSKLELELLPLFQTIGLEAESEPNHLFEVNQLAVLEESIDDKSTILDEPVEVLSVSTTKQSKSEETIDLLARIIEAEARGEPYEGMVAVGQVVLNRVDHEEFPNTVHDVIYQPRQFEPVMNGTIKNEATEKAREAAKEAIAGKGLVENALYFYNPKIAAGQDWFDTLDYIDTIGNHVFRK